MLFCVTDLIATHYCCNMASVLFPPPPPSPPPPPPPFPSFPLVLYLARRASRLEEFAPVMLLLQ